MDTSILNSLDIVRLCFACIRSLLKVLVCFFTALSKALSSTSSLRFTSTGTIPHQRMFVFDRREFLLTKLLEWLHHTGLVLMNVPVQSKYDKKVEVIRLDHVNPQYVSITRQGQEQVVSKDKLARLPTEIYKNDSTSRFTRSMEMESNIIDESTQQRSDSTESDNALMCESTREEFLSRTY
ncbi:hypothetical protein GJ496_010135 [Pomphorhynchus laevis]|nr:hypothetical protein GJ496_010135 [Pomphorhynchus laevis]